jgi:kynurenine aminotransferase
MIQIQFYCEEHANIGEAYARFASCKDVDTLGTAAERLQKLKNYIQ